MNIKDEILKKYKLVAWEEYLSCWEEEIGEVQAKKDYCQLFLNLTDHIPNKIIEAQVLGKEVDDYKEILELRQEAREIIGSSN